MTTPIIFDTDMASDVDDALALALILASPELELVACTVIGREPDIRAAVTKKLLQLAGRDEVPVFAGCRVPVLLGDRLNWFGHEGVGILEPGEAPAVEREHAVDALLRLTRDRDDLEIAAVGPMTNLGVALMKDPDFAGRVRKLHVMGGHIGKVTYAGHTFDLGVDYNLCADPHASYVLLRSGIPTRLVTADVTLQTRITAADAARIRGVGSTFHDALAAHLDCWTPVQNRLFGDAGCDVSAHDNAAFLHDPLTLSCVYDPTFCTFETLEIDATLENEGTVLHTRPVDVPTPTSAPMECAVSVVEERYRHHFMDRVVGLQVP